PTLAADVAAVYDTIPGVFGPEDNTLAFGRAWCGLRGVRAEPGMRQRIYELERVAADLPVVPGALRTATRADGALVIAWFDAFHQEAGVPGGDFVARVEQRIEARRIHVWDVAGDAVSLAGIAGRSPNGARIGPVYTPPPLRGRGYATAAVAELSRRVLHESHRFCFLYTDLANPTSNAIYERIGYRPVCDVVDALFQR
ncbi:MAG: GNAT family N-acetyltransferase, partial [Longimicrobiales bacterium]